MTVRTYDVPDISCDHCRDAIEGGLGPRPDVERVRVDVDARRVEVEGSIGEDELRAALDDLGYETVTPVS